jgi:hypothetical protein
VGMKRVVVIDKLVKQVMRQVGTIVDDICLHDREDGVAAAARLRG